MVFNTVNSSSSEMVLNSFLLVAKEAVKHNIEKLVLFPGKYRTEGLNILWFLLLFSCCIIVSLPTSCLLRADRGDTGHLLAT